MPFTIGWVVPDLEEESVYLNSGTSKLQMSLS